MTKTRTPFNGQENNMFQILNLALAEIENHHSTLERKLQHNLTYMSSIAAAELVAHLHLFRVGEIPHNLKVLALLFAAIYFAIAGLSLSALWPQSRGSLPFEPTWDKIRKWWANDSVKYRTDLLSAYAEIWDENQGLLDTKVWKTQLSYKLMVMALCIVLLQAYVYARYGVAG